MNEKFKYITIDDERATHLIIQHLMKEEDEWVSLEEFQDPIAALHYINAHPEIDLVFLDIDMPYLSGFELLQQIEHQPLVVIITAHAQRYAVEGYQFISKGVIHLLEKPIDQARLKDALNYFKELKSAEIRTPVPVEIESGALEQLIVQKKNEWHTLAVADITHLSVDGNYVYFYTTDQNNYTKYCSLDEILKQLPQSLFVQVNRQTVVNLMHVESYTQSQIQIRNATDETPLLIPISHRRRKEVYEQITKFKEKLS
ncbi:MAG TPA: response regulator transcription factor [Bacteroidales bacterium]|jgi:DNA-binding LytR/AlgR family response regulator|nr:response regulator transcription factor [Bacteroidales bacterium]